MVEITNCELIPLRALMKTFNQSSTDPTDINAYYHRFDRYIAIIFRDVQGAVLIQEISIHIITALIDILPSYLKTHKE